MPPSIHVSQSAYDFSSCCRNQNRDDSEAALLPERAPPSVPFPQSSCAFAECSAPWFVSPAHRPVARRGMADQDDDDDGNEGKLSAEARSVATCKRGGRVETHGHDDVDREDDGSRGSLMGQGEGEELRSDDEVRGSRGNAGKKFRQNLGQESSDANEKEHRRQTSRRGVISQLEWGAAGGQQDAGRLVGVRKRDWASVSGVKIEKKRGAEGVTCGSEKGIRGNCARISIVNKKSQGAVDRGKGKTGKLCNDTRTSAVKKEEEYIQARGKVKVGELCIAVRSSKEGRSDSVLDERGDFGTCFERRDMDDAFDDEITFAASQGKRRRHVLRKPEDIETSQDEHDDMKHPTLRGDLQIVRRALVKVEHQISSGAPFAEDAFGHEHQVAVRVLETGALQGGRNGETAGHAKEQHTLLSVHPEKVASEEYWKRQNAKAAEGISHTHLAEKGQGFARQAARSRRDPDVMVRSILGDDCDRVRHKHKEREDDLRTVLFQSPEMISRQEVRKQKEKKEVEAVKAQREAQHLEEQKQKGRREMKRDRYEQEAETLILHEEATRMKQQVQEMREQEDGQIEIERFVQQQEEKEEEAERIKQPEKETKRLKRQTKEGQEADLLGQQEKELQHSKQQESGANQHVKQQDSDDALAGRRQRTNKKITEWWVAS